jgi:sensor domain CHASE-containing protein
MISPKLAVLMATMAMIGIGTGALPMAAAQQASEVDVERNNEIDQSIKQKQEACTNEAETSLSDDDGVDIVGDNEAEAEQFNLCAVTQTQTGTNTAAVVDNSDNDVDLESILADVGLDL